MKLNKLNEIVNNTKSVLKIGKIIGDRFKSIAEFMGGIILLVIGIKILIEHTYFH